MVLVAIGVYLAKVEVAQENAMPSPTKLPRLASPGRRFPRRFLVVPAVLTLAAIAPWPGSLRAAAQEGIVPPGFRGSYVREVILDAMLSRKGFVEGLEPNLEVTANAVIEETAQEASRYLVTVAEGAGKKTTLWTKGEYGEGESTTVLVKRRGRATQGEGKQLMVRLQDVAPSLAHFDLRTVPLVALLARGYRLDDGRLLLLEDVVDWQGAGRRHAFLGTGGGAGGGPDAPNAVLRGLTDAGALNDFGTMQPESFRLGWGKGHKDFMITQKEGNLILEEMDPADGPGPSALEGGVVIRATLLPQPPYRVMADTLSLRATPEWKARRTGALHLGDRVSIWTRTRKAVTRGSLTGHFGLIQRGKQMGWAFLPYLGRLLPPDGASERFTTVSFSAKDAPIYESWLDEDGAHCGLRPKGAASELDFVTFGGMTPRTAEWALANLDGDGRLDPACVMRDGTTIRVCAYRSLDAKDKGLLGAGCVVVHGDDRPDISSKDQDGDGHRDLKIGSGGGAKFFRFDPVKKIFVAP